jgi:hypothetical protein
MVTLAPAEILSGPIVPEGYSKEEYDAAIEAVAKQCAQTFQIECPLTHHFSPGIYCREILMPGGTFVVGHTHKTQHLNVILSGKVYVLMDGKIQYIEGPAVIESNPGVRKVLLIEEETRWMTVHSNPSDNRDICSLEEEMVVIDDEMKQAKGRLTLDEFRLLVNEQIKKEENIWLTSIQ